MTPLQEASRLLRESAQVTASVIGERPGAWKWIRLEYARELAERAGEMLTKARREASNVE